MTSRLSPSGPFVASGSAVLKVTSFPVGLAQPWIPDPSCRSAVAFIEGGSGGGGGADASGVTLAVGSQGGRGGQACGYLANPLAFTMTVDVGALGAGGTTDEGNAGGTSQITDGGANALVAPGGEPGVSFRTNSSGFGAGGLGGIPSAAGAWVALSLDSGIQGAPAIVLDAGAANALPGGPGAVGGGAVTTAGQQGGRDGEAGSVVIWEFSSLLM